MECGAEDVVRGNVCTMAPGDAVPFGADWCAIRMGDRDVLYVTHRDGTRVVEQFTTPEERATIHRILRSVRPPGHLAVVDSAAAD